MKMFSDVTIKWGEAELTVPDDKVMMLINKIEDHISLADLLPPAKPKLTDLSYAYAAAINYASRVCDEKISVTPDEVYASLFRDGFDVATAVNALFMMMVPPENYKPQVSEGK